MAWARTVAVVVPSPATSEVLLATSRTICAPMFSSESLSSISLATVTPSLVMVGEPNFFSMTTLRPLGPRVTFTASASRLAPRSCKFFLGRAGEDSQYFFFTHDDEIFTIEFNFGTGILAEQDAVALFYGQGEYLALIVALAFADGDDFSLLMLFFGAVGDDDASTGGLAFLNTAD